MKRLLLRLTTLHAAMVCATFSFAQETKLATIFTDHMVLQRDWPVAIWGDGKPGDTVTVEFAGQRQPATVDKDGHWQATLKPLPASDESRNLVVRSGDGQSITQITNVLVGEVWIGSGQSNMEWMLKNTDNAQNAAAVAGDNLLRLFTVAKSASSTPLRQVNGQWSVCTSNNVLSFSAVGYYFGRDLRRALKVPVGIINSSWGGTPAQAWTPRPALLAVPSLKGLVDGFDNAVATYDPAQAAEQYKTALEKWKVDTEKAKAEGKQAPREPRQPSHPGNNPRSPSTLYNGMIAPLVPLTCRGVIWYQGEADNGASAQYRVLFPVLIESWRKAFGRELPFLFVQIAPHKGMSPDIRDAQLHVWRTVPATAMAVITDHGEADNIHPRAKEPVGARLALAARAIAYGEKITYSGPVFDKVAFDGPRAILTFQHIGTGLMAKDGPLRGFEIAGANTNFVPAVATIDGDRVILQSEQVAEPQAVRYGWANVPDVNLFNKEGLPATPFRAAAGH